MQGSWRSVEFRDNYASGVPAAPGVYAIVCVRRVHTLPIAVEMIYAGRSVNLRQKFRRHVLPWLERNKGISKSELTWEFWFKRLPPSQLDFVEREIIRHAEPPGNQFAFREQSRTNEQKKGRRK